MKKRKPNHPGSILKYHYLDQLDLTITEVADVLNVSRKTLSKIINGRASITPDIALRLSKAFDTTAELWLNMQQKYNLWDAANKSREWKRVAKIKLRVASATS